MTSGSKTKPFAPKVFRTVEATINSRDAEPSKELKPPLCIACCNHWSYTGIGWTLGLESCVLSLVDAMEMADREPHVKTCINHDARAYELVADKFPEVAAKLSTYLRDGRVELVGGSYGQPHGTMYSGESNIRQIVLGKQAIRKALGYDVVTFLEQEEFSHPQLPQILSGAGYRNACLHQVDTWGRAGVPLIELNAFQWKGLDGTTIPTIPKTTLRKITGATVGSTTIQHVDRERLVALSKLGKPILFSWEEFGWEEPDRPAYLTKPEKYKRFVEMFATEFVTLGEYLDKHGRDAREAIFLNMDSWDKLLAWGIGGDQLRVLDRQVEASLLAAERLDAIACAGGASSQSELLESAWKHLLVAQSHDAALCEYTRWQGHRTPPLNRIEDYHNSTWGAIGYSHLDAAQKGAKTAIDASLTSIANESRTQDEHALTVFNPLEWTRTTIAQSGHTHSLPVNAKAVRVTNKSGRAVPSQIVHADRDGHGNLVAADILFPAENVSGLGFDTYRIEFTSESFPPAHSDLKIDADGFAMENEHLAVRLDPRTGAIASLVEKKSRREFLASPGPLFTGRGETEVVPSKHITPPSAQELATGATFDSSQSRATVRWTDRGPVRATIAASHTWPFLKFETYVSLTAAQRWVEITSRVLATVPPLLDERATSGWPPFSANIEQGYWLSFHPSFAPRSVMRDIPLGIEPATRDYFHALTFADFVGADAGLLVLHPGTQYFKRHPDGRISNLLMREWGSYWDGEFGWPRYTEYRHALLPHGPDFSNVDRTRATAEFSQPVLVTRGTLAPMDAGDGKNFALATPNNVRIASLRSKSADVLEIRVTEIAGQSADARLELQPAVQSVFETNLLGERIVPVSIHRKQIRFDLHPWQMRTFELQRKR